MSPVTNGAGNNLVNLRGYRMTENERLANEMYVEIMRAVVQYLAGNWSAEQFIGRIRMITKAANL